MPRAALYDIAEAADTKQAILDAVNPALPKIRHLYSARILVALYIRPKKDKNSGLWTPDSQSKEDVYQGRVGLVLMKGPMVYKGEEFQGQNVEIGDWVSFVPGDGRRIQINGVDCRIIEDTMIDMIVDDPDVVTHRQ